jgi:hypothetical protein
VYQNLETWEIKAAIRQLAVSRIRVGLLNLDIPLSPLLVSGLRKDGKPAAYIMVVKRALEQKST